LKFCLICAAVAVLPTLALAEEAAKPAPAKAPPPSATPKTVGEVVVTGQAAPVQVGIDRKSYSVAGDLQAQTGAIADALRNLPQVEVDVQGNVSLRGDPNVTILIDGKPSSQFSGDNRAIALQQLPADAIERVEVITNPSAEFRAEGSAGVINLITKKAKGIGLTGSLRLTLGESDRFAAGASVGYNSPRLAVTGDLNLRQDAQKSTTSDVRQQPDPAGGFDTVEQAQVTHIIANTFGGRGSVDYDLTPRTRVGLESHFNYTFFRVDNPTLFTALDPAGAFAGSFDRQLTVHQKRSAGEVSANLREKVGAEGEFLTSLSYEGTVDPRVRFGRTFERIPPAPEAVDEQRIDNHLHRTELKGDLTLPQPQMAKLKAGFDLEYIDNAYRNRGFAGPSEAALAPDPALTNLFLFRQTLSAAYVTYERPVADVTVLAGLRVENLRMDLDQATLGQKDRNGYLAAYPSLHLAWKLSDTQQLTASYSHRVQRPDPNEFNAFRFLVDPLNYRAGNPDLKPQQTQSFEAAYEYRQAPVLFLATAYYRESRDGGADVVRPLGGGIYLSERNNAAQSRSGGLELVANGRLTKGLTYNLSGAVAWTQLDSLGPRLAPTRSLISPSGHGSLTWQASDRDLFQLNAFMNPKRLTPQGSADAMVGIDLGYRRKLTDKVSLVFTAQDLFRTFHARQVIDTPSLRETTQTHFDTRQVRLALTWTFGGGRPRDPGFEFQNGSGPPQ
jgi:outer membrane receptor protein involved in Fe transport